jgi:hypothetical protein
MTDAVLFFVIGISVLALVVGLGIYLALFSTKSGDSCSPCTGDKCDANAKSYKLDSDKKCTVIDECKDDDTVTGYTLTNNVCVAYDIAAPVTPLKYNTPYTITGMGVGNADGGREVFFQDNLSGNFIFRHSDTSKDIKDTSLINITDTVVISDDPADPLPDSGYSSTGGWYGIRVLYNTLLDNTSDDKVNSLTGPKYRLYHGSDINGSSTSTLYKAVLLKQPDDFVRVDASNFTLFGNPITITAV